MFGDLDIPMLRQKGMEIIVGFIESGPEVGEVYTKRIAHKLYIKSALDKSEYIGRFALYILVGREKPTQECATGTCESWGAASCPAEHTATAFCRTGDLHPHPTQRRNARDSVYRRIQQRHAGKLSVASPRNAPRCGVNKCNLLSLIVHLLLFGHLFFSPH